MKAIKEKEDAARKAYAEKYLRLQREAELEILRKRNGGQESTQANTLEVQQRDAVDEVAAKSNAEQHLASTQTDLTAAI